MDIGKPERIIEVQPEQAPKREEQPAREAPAEKPVTEPSRKPVPV